jgi:hypothetical protein
MFGSAKLMQIENNVATIEHTTGDYRIVVTVEHLNAPDIKQEDAEIVLTNNMLRLFSQRQRFGG